MLLWLFALQSLKIAFCLNLCMWLEKELITSKKAAKAEMGSLHGDRIAIAIVTTLVAVNLIVFLG